MAKTRQNPDRKVEVQVSGGDTTVRHSFYLWAKRCFDLVLSLLASILMSAPLLILCARIMLEDYGNPFYVQQRVGQNGEKLPMVKLRSMKIGSDDIHKTLTPEQLQEYRREY